ncbi:5'-nucleotidase /3'-nucleotidase /exopolyphosphatase [Cognatiyoonia sediminum]|uniref:5'-nucleotidase SurE n=2 Tax=Cognatiyoonia sediminum TaxID=1508389 RepID=A0A1M5LIN1_9RHOB|nr:5'-nucleotidase /3'-nucleotidase /exopolyphosphatase [Cognatiyoonia sediminum]
MAGPKSRAAQPHNLTRSESTTPQRIEVTPHGLAAPSRALYHKVTTAKGKHMRILITNDDGIDAPGLKTLEAIAKTVAGETGEVWTVAPAFEQSGVGHCINYTRPTMTAQYGTHRFAVEGSPADCVLAGIHHMMKDAPPDLILSGVNRGNNAGENTLYSGTVGACIEAALQGYKSIALSQYYGSDNRDLDDPFEAAATHGAELVQQLLDNGGWDGADYKLFFNVNFPPTSADTVKGIRAVSQGFRQDVTFGVTSQTSPSGRNYLWVKGGPQNQPTLPGTDVHANLNGYISVTPMRADLTDYSRLATLQDIFR